MLLNEIMKNPKIPHGSEHEYWVFFDKNQKPYLVHLDTHTQTSTVVTTLKLTSLIFRVYQLPKQGHINPLTPSNEVGLCILLLDERPHSSHGTFSTFSVSRKQDSGKGIGSELFRLANYKFNQHHVTSYTGYAKPINYTPLNELIELYRHLKFKVKGQNMTREVYRSETANYQKRIHEMTGNNHVYHLIAPRDMPKNAVLKEINAVKPALIPSAVYYENIHHTKRVDVNYIKPTTDVALGYFHSIQQNAVAAQQTQDDLIKEKK